MALQFSENGEYFAEISIDGKLKVWNTLTNSFEQEFTPDFHLASPCTCLHFVEANSLKYKGASPKKKKPKDSGTNSGLYIILGTTSGLLLVYSISKANLDYTINSETSQSLTCLSAAYHNEIYSGAEQNVFVWNLEKRKLVSKWKVGNEKVSAILAIPESQRIITATKNISLWDVKTKEVLKTFTGHSSEVTLLRFIAPQSNGNFYFISGSKGDKLLNCWSLDESSGDKNAIASFLMDDVIQNISVNITADRSTNIAATVKSGVVHIYQHSLNGKCVKPIKPKTTIQIVSDVGHSNDFVTPIRIFGAIYRGEESLCIGHGTEVLLTFENVAIISQKKIQCLVRKDPRTLALSKPDQHSKTITPIVNDEVHYLTSQLASVSNKKRKNDVGLEMPMEKRLENLNLNTLEGESKVPKSDNLAQLLVQGLHSKDKNILRTVLSKSEEHIVKNTVKRLPFTVLGPLIQELIEYLRDKPKMKSTIVLWLRHIMQIHGGIIISNPDLIDLFRIIIAIGKADIPIQASRRRFLEDSEWEIESSQETSESEQAVLEYNDCSDSDEGDQMEVDSDSENEFEDDGSDEEELDEGVQMGVDSENENELEEDGSDEEEVEENNISSESESDS